MVQNPSRPICKTDLQHFTPFVFKNIKIAQFWHGLDHTIFYTSIENYSCVTDFCIWLWWLCLPSVCLVQVYPFWAPLACTQDCVFFMIVSVFAFSLQNHKKKMNGQSPFLSDILGDSTSFGQSGSSVATSFSKPIDLSQAHATKSIVQSYMLARSDKEK